MEVLLPWPSPRTLFLIADVEVASRFVTGHKGSMTSTDEKRFVAPAWAVSFSLHGLVVVLAIAFSAQIKPLVHQDRFTWDVAFVQQANPVSQSEPVESMAASVQPSVKKGFPSRPRSMPESSQSVKPTEQNIDLPPIEQKVEVPQLREESMEQRIVETATPVAEPTVEAKMNESVALDASSEPTESRPAQQEPTVMASASLSSSEVPISQESTVNAVATPGPEAKADNRWLAESLWRRVAELKRYPSSARLNGQEGKVILKAVIRSDGQLADVFVQKSSGYSALDAAAIEAVKLACPLEMKHAIGKPQIVVSLPIVYSLAN